VTPSFSFTNWAADGVGVTDVRVDCRPTSNVRVVVTGQNHNHHRFVAADLDWQPSLPTRQSTWGQVKALYLGK
jgi:hypothetical protein